MINRNPTFSVEAPLFASSTPTARPAHSQFAGPPPPVTHHPPVTHPAFGARSRLPATPSLSPLHVGALSVLCITKLWLQ